MKAFPRRLLRGVCALILSMGLCLNAAAKENTTPLSLSPLSLEEYPLYQQEERAADEPSVIVTRRPCALLKYVKHNPPLTVDVEKCKNCKACMRIGCPAISMSTGKAKIDNTLCVGCGLCTQMCKFDAIEE